MDVNEYVMLGLPVSPEGQKSAINLVPTTLHYVIAQLIALKELQT